MLPCRFYRLFTQWLREESVIPVTFSRNRLESGQKLSLETAPPPRDRLSLGGQSELMSWWFVPDHIHSTSSSTPMLRHNRSALAVTLKGIPFDFFRRCATFSENFSMSPKGPFNFSNLLQQTGFSKNPKALPHNFKNFSFSSLKYSAGFRRFRFV